MSDDEKVGYGKPPKSGQFKPGESGNPKGRPPNESRGTIDVVELFDGEIKVHVKGKEKSMTHFEVILRQLAKKAMKKDVRAIRTFIELMEKYGALQEATPQQGGVLVAPKGLTPEEWISGKTLDGCDDEASDNPQNGTLDQEGRLEEGDRT